MVLNVMIAIEEIMKQHKRQIMYQEIFLEIAKLVMRQQI
jgi:hypothetical protein